MRPAAFGWVLLAGCGTQSTSSFLIETADCTLVNNFTVDGAATPWTDCRVYWSGLPYQTLTVELTLPNTTGSFLSPAAGWMRASLHAPGDVAADLTTMMFPDAMVPTSVPDDKIALDLPVTSCGNLGATQRMVDVMAEVGDRSASFSANLGGSCSDSGGTRSLAGGFLVTASGFTPSSVDVGTLVTTTE